MKKNSMKTRVMGTVLAAICLRDFGGNRHLNGKRWRGVCAGRFGIG